jgi:hypothetical protein
MFMQQTRGVKGFEVGTWGGEFHPEFDLKPGDVVVKEHFSQNGFASTDRNDQQALLQARIETNYQYIAIGLPPASIASPAARHKSSRKRAATS